MNRLKHLLRKLILEEVNNIPAPQQTPAKPASSQQAAKPVAKQTIATQKYQQATQNASAVKQAALQIKSVNDVPGAFESWFNSLGLPPNTSKTTVISMMRDTLNKMEQANQTNNK